MSVIVSGIDRNGPVARAITLGMKIALGLLHAGALYRQASGDWRGRAFPERIVRDATVRGLEERGLATMREYEGLHGVKRVCVVLTPSGHLAYRDGVLAARQAPPVAAEAVLVEIEAALAALQRESADLARDLADLVKSHRHLKWLESQTARRFAAIESRLGALERAKASLDARRADLCALVDLAALRLAGTAGDQLA